MPKGRIGVGDFDDNIANTIIKTQAMLRREAQKRFGGGNAKGAYKFKKSAGANSSSSRFGTDEPAPKKPRRTMEYRFDPTKPKKPRRTMEYRYDPTKPKRGPIPAIAGPARQDYIDGKKKLPLRSPRTKPSSSAPKAGPKRVRPRGGSANIRQMPKIYKRGK